MSERFAALHREACDLAFALGAASVGCNVVNAGPFEVCRAMAEWGQADGAIVCDHPDHEAAMALLVEALKALATKKESTDAG